MRAQELATPGPSLGAVFLAASRKYPSHVALDISDCATTYGELADLSGRIASALLDVERPRPKLGAVFATRSKTAYAGVLGTLLSGAGYVPLNPKFPLRRNAQMLAASQARTLVVGAECMSQLPELLAASSVVLTVIIPELEDMRALRDAQPRHTYVGASDLALYVSRDRPPDVDPAEIAYLLFTSGSTGDPKGVMVSHSNVLAFLDAMWARYEIVPSDRFSQTFDLTFDLSAFDVFASLGRGASLHCLPTETLMVPDEYIRSHQLTVWFSVPSVGMMLRKLRRLTPNAFPSLRWALFCGERLPSVVAADWQRASPSATVENLYGPTEATIACTLYRWSSKSLSECVDGVVPIGVPYPGMSAVIVDEKLGRCFDGVKGELCMKGPQVTHGYWQDPRKTAERFVEMPWFSGPDNRWYRTGDLAYIDDTGQLIHAGRNDDQVKLRGFRIELPEVEHAVREAAATSFAVVLPYPSDATGLQGLTAVIAQTNASEDEILRSVRLRLPEYMVPQNFLFVAEMPLNANGKIDRPALLQRLRENDKL
jgi:amino acid adenylation domain-containing protein